MRFNFFHLMPYDKFPERVEQWPVNNAEFDPQVAQGLYNEYIDTMVYAEECGWDSVGCNEHHFSPYGLMSNCNLIGSALIQRTKKVKIAMFGNLVPLVNPIRVAEEYAMLDVISGGRLMTGFMRGIPHEYIAYGIAPGESRPRLAEATQLIRKAWTEPAPFGWEGEYYKYRAVSLWPKPMQKPHPPILYSGSNPESARVAGHNRMMLGMVFIPNLEAGRQVIDAYIEAANEAGWNPGPEHILCGFHTCIAETDAAAREHLSRGVKYFMQVLMAPQREAQQIVVEKSRYFGTDGAGEYFLQRLNHAGERSIEGAIEDGTVLCGSPETVVKQIKRIHAELGCGWINTNMKIGNIPNGVVRKGMELFRDHVQAEVRDLAKSSDDMPQFAAAGE
ncbi:MAG: LLM class flavin-dependent oxidoreductase [Rhodospirillales bacterium]|nr:LLM class flavin-dependent oxidoreductase [Rhodospirillales bacterium]